MPSIRGFFTDPTDDNLYAGTANGVWKLNNPGADFSAAAPVWEQVGLDMTDPANPVPTMPAVPVSAISLNTSTGILGAATYGRGVYEIQIRGLISGQVFEDTNGNGIQETGELGTQGVTVRLLDLDNNNAEIATTTTDANGFYEFRSLRDGNYRVTVSGSGGIFQTTTQPSDFVNFTEQSTFDNVDFGFFRAGSISGKKIEDLNANGVADTGEAGLGGFVIYIDRNNNGVLDAGEPFCDHCCKRIIHIQFH